MSSSFTYDRVLKISLASYTILLACSLPLRTREMTLYNSSTHDPLLLFPSGLDIRLLHLRHLEEQLWLTQDVLLDESDEVATSIFLRRIKRYFVNKMNDNEDVEYDHQEPPVRIPFDKGWTLRAKWDDQVTKNDLVGPINKVRVGCHGSLIAGISPSGILLYGVRPDLRSTG